MGAYEHRQTDSSAVTSGADFACSSRPAIIVRLYELWRHFYGVFDGGGEGEGGRKKRRACCSNVTVMQGTGEIEHRNGISFCGWRIRFDVIYAAIFPTPLPLHLPLIPSMIFNVQPIAAATTPHSFPLFPFFQKSVHRSILLSLVTECAPLLKSRDEFCTRTDKTTDLQPNSWSFEANSRLEESQSQEPFLD